MLLKNLFLFVVMASVSACGQNNKKQLTEEECSGPDSDIECSFINMPKDISHIMSIADESEPGERIIIKGRFLKPDGKTPQPDVLMYAYHTNAGGVYPKKGDEKGIQKWNGYLHGWIKSNESGEYEIHTIRPGSYPNSSNQAHIHAALKPPASAPYYISDFLFKDDPLLKDKSKGIEFRKENGVWIGEREIILK